MSDVTITGPDDPQTLMRPIERCFRRLIDELWFGFRSLWWVKRVGLNHYHAPPFPCGLVKGFPIPILWAVDLIHMHSIRGKDHKNVAL